jgi:hypothetical protein
MASWRCYVAGSDELVGSVLLFNSFLMDSLLSLFPVGGSVQPLASGAVMLHYGTDGCAVVHPDGFVSGDRYVIKKLAYVFGKKDVSFVKVGNGLLLNPVASWLA